MYVIAEIGSNWAKGPVEERQELCIKQMGAAKDCGADAVKFQMFTHEELYGLPGKLDNELPREWVPYLVQEAKKLDLVFLCSAFSLDGLRFLNDHVGSHKIASSEASWQALVMKAISYEKPVFLSTGGMSFQELNALYDLTEPNLIVMDCVAAYPAETSDYNYTFIDFLYHNKIECGISDHTHGVAAAVLAQGLGATYCEKHFDAFPHLGKTADAPVSCLPAQFEQYCDVLKGNRVLMPKDRKSVENDMLLKHRRRLIYTRDVKPGDKLALGVNYGVYRSLKAEYEAMSPQAAEKVNGHIAKYAHKAGEGLGPNEY